VIDEVRVDKILEISASIVGQKDVNCFRVLVGAALGCYSMVVGGYDGWNVSEQAVGFDLAHGLLDGFGAKWTSDLLEREELMRVGIFDEVDIGEAALQIE
jgi:hypothetical protein